MMIVSIKGFDAIYIALCHGTHDVRVSRAYHQDISVPSKRFRTFVG